MMKVIRNPPTNEHLCQRHSMKKLTVSIVILAVIISAGGLLMPNLYRDTDLFKVAWRANHLVTLLLAPAPQRHDAGEILYIRTCAGARRCVYWRTGRRRLGPPASVLRVRASGRFYFPLAVTGATEGNQGIRILVK